jgi:hypothetical protein
MDGRIKLNWRIFVPLYRDRGQKGNIQRDAATGVDYESQDCLFDSRGRCRIAHRLFVSWALRIWATFNALSGLGRFTEG